MNGADFSKLDPRFAPPHSPDAERAILGAVLINNPLILKTREQLTPDDFCLPRNRRLFQLYLQLVDGRQNITADNLAAALGGSLDEIGGAAYLGEIEAAVLSSEHVEGHVRIVATKSAQRKAMALAVDLTVKAATSTDGADAVLESAVNGLNDIRRDTAAAMGKPTGPETINACALQGMEFREPRQIIKGLRPEGLTVLAARPKKGKSWLELSNGIAIATGAPALGLFPTDQGDVLYLALEDSERRLQSRMTMLLHDTPWPVNLEFRTSWRHLDRGGLDDLAAWLANHPDAAAVVIDTFSRIRPTRRKDADAYQADAEATAGVQSLALKHHAAIVLIVHQRKAMSADPFDSVNGSFGLTASADAVAILTRAKDGAGKLEITGRDLEERTLSMRFDGGVWKCLGDAGEAEDSEDDPLDDAKDFLRQTLANGPAQSETLFTLAREAGISRRRMFAAKDGLGIRAKKNGYQGAWTWELPTIP